MAINMGLTLLPYMCILITVHCITPEADMSSENINEILDTLIQQTQQINETSTTTDMKDLTTLDETTPSHPLNDSNIYYFKTNVKPHINFESSSDATHETRPSNKTVQSNEVSNENHDLSSEDKLFPGASKITRKSLLGLQKQRSTIQSTKKEFIPRLVHGGHTETKYSEYKSRTGKPDSDENNSALQEFIRNEIVTGLNTNDDSKQVSLTQSDAHNMDQLKLLHEFPEIIIDHITYDNDEKDKNNPLKLKSVHEGKHVQNVVKGEINNRVPSRKIRYKIPEEDIDDIDNWQNYPMPEQFGSSNYLTPEMKDLIDVIIQKKVMQDAILKQTTESESRKQSMLLEKILQRLPEQRQMINVKSGYSVRHERITPPEMHTLSHLRSSLNTLHRNGGNHLANSYLKVPYAPSKWEIRNRLLRRLTRLYRPDVLKHHRLVGLMDRVVPNINYQPVYYDVYKK